MGNSNSKRFGSRTFVRRPDFHGEEWTLARRYEPVDYINKGAFGQVISAFDKKRKTTDGENARVAIKKFADIFSRPAVAKSVYREIRFMKALNHPHVLSLLDVFAPAKNAQSIREIYIVMPLMESDLHHYMSTAAAPRDDLTIRSLASQIVEAVRYLHSGGIVHRDIKPSNICIRNGNYITLVDLGLSKWQEADMTRGAGTPCFMAPEVIFFRQYDTKADMFSVGLILIFLYTRRFAYTGKNIGQSAHNMFNLLGSPPREFFDRINPVIRAHLREDLPGVHIDEILPMATWHARLLVRNLLSYNPADRMTAEQALDHYCLRPFIVQGRNLTLPMQTGGGEFLYMREEDWRNVLYEEISRYEKDFDKYVL